MPPNPPPPKRTLILRAVMVAGFVAMLAGAFFHSSSAVDVWQLVFYGVWIVAIIMTLAFAPLRLRTLAKNAAIVFGLMAALIVGYSYRDDLNGVLDRALGAIDPSAGTVLANGAMRFGADTGGQFHIDATVDGTAIRFLVDTGASGIALSQRDARRLGFKAGDLRYSTIFSTANGTTRGAPVTLASLHIGPIVATRVPAWVNEGNLDESLLGMSFLSTLGRVEISKGALTIER
jgi:aspartyl protease family protein